MTDAAKARRGGGDVRLQYFFDGGAQGEIGEADYTSRDASLTVSPTRALRGDAVDEFGLAHRLQRFGTVRAIHREAFDEYGRDHPMTSSGVTENLVEQIATLRMVPEMMMRVDDWQRRLKRFFVDLSQPRVGDKVCFWSVAIGFSAYHKNPGKPQCPELGTLIRA